MGCTESEGGAGVASKRPWVVTALNAASAKRWPAVRGMTDAE